jgi:hypothetical protein
MLYLASKQWEEQEDQVFQDMLNTIKKLDPKCADLVLILRVKPLFFLFSLPLLLSYSSC